MKKVLWLVSWYPNESEPFSGDFIQRQAEAVSLFQPLNIIYVGKQKKTKEDHLNLQIESKTENLKEYKLYYESSNNFLSKIDSLYTYFKKNLAIVKQFLRNNEMPDLVHVQVAMKAGLVALYLKWRYKIPYVLTEHWTGYYQQSADSLFTKSFLMRYLTKQILRNATWVLPVSNALGNQINQYWASSNYQKIPNVVNTRFFFQASEQITTFRFIHVSSLAAQKNPEGIIRVFKELLDSGIDAELILVGPIPSKWNEYLMINNLPLDKIKLTGEISYELVAAEVRKSSALVMFSFYENMPCVILEALCAGIPVIATHVGGIPEVIDKENGILIEAGNETELLDAMKKMIRNYNSFNKEKISRNAAEQFSYEVVGREIVAIYNSVLQK